MAGVPTARAPGGTCVSFSTTAFAPTIAPVPTTTRCSTIAPEETCAPSQMVQASRCTRWPITQSFPTTVGVSGVVCSTQLSWMLVRSPTITSPSSPRSTAPGQMDESAPTVTAPISTASGCTKAVGCTRGTRSPSAYIATTSRYRAAPGP